MKKLLVAFVVLAAVGWVRYFISPYPIEQVEAAVMSLPVAITGLVMSLKKTNEFIKK